MLTTVYLFYLNRILAWIAGALIRISTWSKDKDRVYIDIGAFRSALQIHIHSTHPHPLFPESVTVSLLKGTISLKNFRYHTSNQTIKLAKCSIIWRYWLRHPKGLDEGEDSEAGVFSILFIPSRVFMPCHCQASPALPKERTAESTSQWKAWNGSCTTGWQPSMI